MKTYGEWRYSSTILDLGTRWRWVVSFTPLPLCPSTDCIGGLVSPRVGLDCGEDDKSCPSGNRTRAVQSVASRYTERKMGTWKIRSPV
jgi:hypothetical protein